MIRGCIHTSITVDCVFDSKFQIHVNNQAKKPKNKISRNSLQNIQNLRLSTFMKAKTKAANVHILDVGTSREPNLPRRYLWCSGEYLPLNARYLIKTAPDSNLSGNHPVGTQQYYRLFHINEFQESMFLLHFLKSDVLTVPLPSNAVNI